MATPVYNESGHGLRRSILFEWLLLLPAATALLVYLATMSRGAFPGESAWLMVQASGLAPHLYVDRPLWSLIIAGLALLPSADFAFWFNLFSVISGVIAVFLCSKLVAQIVDLSIPSHVKRMYPGMTATATLCGGLCAGFFLAYSTPFWVASNRAHPAAFHLALLLVAATLLMRYTRKPTDIRLIILVVWYGIGCVEFPTFIVFGPMFGIYVLLFLWLRDMLSVRRIMLIAVSGLAGLSMYLVAAWMVTRTEGFYLRDFQGFGHALWVYWLEQYRLITRGLPQHGWMLTLIVTAIPWLIGVLTVRRALEGDRDKAFRLLYLVLTALTFMVLFNHPIAPWSLIGMRRLMVTPYLLSASLFGMLAASWILLPMNYAENVKHGWKPALRRFAGLVPAVICLAAVGWAPLRNLRAADGRPAELFNSYAEYIVEAAKDKEWLLTDGSLDHHIIIAAHKAGLPLKVMDLTAGHNPVYQRYLAGHFDSLRLRGLLQLGLRPFLQEWLKTTPGIEAKVAVLTVPDLWYSTDFTAVPHLLVFRGAREGNLPDGDALWDEHVVFWDEIIPMLQRYRDSDSTMVSSAAAQFMRHASLAANNLGVLLEDIDRKELAWQAYLKSRELDSDNVSALLNLRILAQQDEHPIPPEVTQSVNEAIVQLEQTLGQQRFRIHRLSQFYGYVRMPHAFADMGWTWALSGNPRMAVSGLRRALAISEDMQGTQSALAAMYLAIDRDTESEAAYREVLARQPSDHQALLGLARIALVRRQFETADKHIASAAKAGAAQTRILFERAVLAVMRDDTEAARGFLDQLVDTEPDNIRAWVLLAQVAVRQDDAQRLDDIARRLSVFASADHMAAMALAEIAITRGDTGDARRYFEQALRIRPGNSHALEQLLRLDLTEERYDLAEQHATRLLETDQDHALGNYTLAILNIRNSQYSLAEVALRKSIAGKRAVYALNDLAEVLVERGRAMEAEQYAREAVALASNSHQTWGTLGKTLLHLRRFPEAVTALEKSLALNMDNVNAGIDLAEALIHLGEIERARNQITHLLTPDVRATVPQRERLADLQRSIRQSSRNP